MQEMMNGFVEQVWSSFQQGDNCVGAKATEAQNVRCLQALYRALGQGDFAAFQNALAEEVEMEVSTTAGGSFHGRWRGASQVTAAVQNNFAQLQESTPTIDEVVAQGESVVVVARERGRFRTGETYDVHWVQWFTFRSGKVARFREVIGQPPDLV
jgi:uncharacterized protein